MRFKLAATAVVAAVMSAAPAAAQERACAPWQPRTVASGLGQLENLEFDGRGSLLLSATNQAAIVRLAPDGTAGPLVPGVSAPGGLRVRGDSLYFNTGNTAQSAIAGSRSGTFERFDFATGTRTALTTGLVAPNGLAFLPNGDAVVSRALGSGTGITRIPMSDPSKPQENWARLDGANGMAVDPTGTWLYAVETFTPQARVYRIRIDDPTQIETVASLGGANVPRGLDDIDIDARGDLYMAANGSAEILRLDPDSGDVCTLTRGPFRNPSAVKLGRGPGWSPQKLYVVAFDGTVTELTPPAGQEPAVPSPPGPPGEPPAPPPAPREIRLDDLAAPTPVAAFASSYAWSRYDPRTRRYRLVIKSGRTWTARIRPRRVPFDVDLGPGPAGTIVAVYSRCRRETPSFVAIGQPNYTDSAGCRLYLYDLLSGRERRLRAGRGAPRSRYKPAIWRRRIAFASGNAVYVARGTQRPRRLRGGRRGGGPTGIDLRGRRVAYTWTYGTPRCVGGDTGGDRSQLWLDNLRTRSHRLIERGGCRTDPARLLISPTLSGGAVTWLRNDAELAQHDLKTAQTRSFTIEPGTVAVARGWRTIFNRLTPGGAGSAVVHRL